MAPSPKAKGRHGSSVRRAQPRTAEEPPSFGGPEVLGRAPGHGAPKAALRRLLGLYLAGLGLPAAQVTLKLVADGASRRLNRRWRGIDASTDVLSFPGLDGAPPRGFDGHLGDLALCLPYAWRKRRRFAPRFGAECAFLILHGLLHLCGRHHDSPAQERRMWQLSRRLHPLGAELFGALDRLAPEGARP
jgi:probable rRNA maturation factor